MGHNANDQAAGPAQNGAADGGTDGPDAPLSGRARVVAAVVALLAGGVFAAVGTVAHQSSFVLVGISWYPGVVLGLAALAAAAIATRLLVEERLPSFCFAGAVIVVVAVFGATGPGGSVLIPQGLPGLVWTVGPALVTVIVALWPRTPRRPVPALAQQPAA